MTHRILADRLFQGSTLVRHGVPARDADECRPIPADTRERALHQRPDAAPRLRSAWSGNTNRNWLFSHSCARITRPGGRAWEVDIRNATHAPARCRPNPHREPYSRIDRDLNPVKTTVKAKDRNGSRARYMSGVLGIKVE